MQVRIAGRAYAWRVKLMNKANVHTDEFIACLFECTVSYDYRHCCRLATYLRSWVYEHVASYT